MKFFIVSLVFALAVSNVDAQQNHRSFVRQKIEEWGECKTVAITLTGGDLAIYGVNGWAGGGLPVAMEKRIRELRDAKHEIKDVQLTEEGRWLILWGRNGVSWGKLHSNLEDKIREYNRKNEEITSVTFNDSGDWIVITTESVSASSVKINDYIKDGMSRYGTLWSAHLTEDALLLCYSGGYKFLGNVPSRLKAKLEETRMDVYRVKFLSDGAYFIADKRGRYAYYL